MDVMDAEQVLTDAVSWNMVLQQVDGKPLFLHQDINVSISCKGRPTVKLDKGL